MNLPLGGVVHDNKGRAWVYFGTTTTTEGTTNHHFRRAVEGKYYDWEYKAVVRETLIKKFPDLTEYWPTKI